MQHHDHEPIIAQMSSWTSSAIDFLKNGNPGDTVTPEAMAAVIGRLCAPDDDGYSNVASAIRHVEKQYRVVWRWVRSDRHWKCLTPAECVLDSDARIRRSRKALKRGVTVAEAVDESALSPDELARHRLQLATMGTMLLFSGGQTQRKLAEAQQAGPLIAPNTDALAKLFGG